ncbi:MAG: beta-lactamase domain protein [Deltaproteobacteria bacterium]|nr:beta-lactamase domain protein [Deltaproteobacteria bacterium]
MDNPIPMTRRSFLATTSCLGAALWAARAFPLPAMGAGFAGGGRVSSQPLADKGFASVRKIGNGVYATVSDPSKGLETVSNGGFIVGTDGALLIEGFRTPAGASFQHAALRQVSSVPVRAALDTHYHFDHTLGNAFYGAQGIPIWAHEKTAPLMVNVYGPGSGPARPERIAAIEKRITDATSDAARERAKGDLNMLKLAFASVDSSAVSLPNRSLEPSSLPLTVDLGGTQAVIESYPGHTPSDLIIRVPQQNVIYTGDLLFNGMYPATSDANLSNWRKTLEMFSGYDKETLFIPGHGPLCGPEGIATLRSVFDDLADQASKMYKAGIPLEEAQQRYDIPERFKDFPIIAWSFCIGPAIAKFYEEFKAGKT